VRRTGIAQAAALAALALATAAPPGLRAHAVPQARPPRPSQAAQQPVFTSGVELIAVDAAVVDRNGNPIAGVRPDQFEITVDGKARRVVSAEFIEFASRGEPAAAKPAPEPVSLPAFSSNLAPAPGVPQGRLIFLAVDQASFKPLAARGVMEAARKFIDRLQPDDRIGLVAFPLPAISVGASRDHSLARSATAKIIGSAQPFRTSGIDKSVSLSEAIDIHANDALTLERVLARECSYARTSADRTSCELDVRNTALSIGRNAERQALQSLHGIEAAIRGLAQIRERKTLVLISAGLPVADRIGLDLQLHPDVVAIGRLAAAANLNLFVLHVDSGFLDAFSAEERTISDTLSRDLGIMSTGLETVAGASGGSLARVVAGADFAFDRVLRETAASYLLGVEPAESDRDGKPHRINVKVRVPNAEVRSRREFVMPKAEAKPASPEEALAAALRAGRQQTGLPIRLATHSLASSSSGGYRVMVSADIGDAISGPVEMRFLYAFVEASGRMLPPVTQKATLRPHAGGAPGTVSYTSESVLRPGTYMLRFAAVDAAGLVGSVDHAFTVGLKQGETVRLSDLLLIEPRQLTTDDIYIVIDGHLRDAAVDAYLEVAPVTPSSIVTGVTFGIADRADSAPLVSVQAPPARAKGAGHWTAGARLNLSVLPPGDYVVTATVLAGERVVGEVTRPVRIERAATAPGGAAAGVPSPPRVSFAAGETGSLVKAFSPQDVLGRDTLEYFLDRMRRASPESASDPSVAIAVESILNGRYDRVITNLVTADPKLLSTSFLKGLALFGKGELEPSAAEFRAALDAAPDFLPAAFYLGACYAAGGRDREAVGAWQTTLISESDARIIYDVLGDALLRLQDGDEAASILTEARDKWTDDDRFVPRLAASEALRRRPQEAIALLDGYVARHPSDANALLLALRLLYEARSAGARLRSAADDTASARRYADLYEAAGGPNQALVDRWVTFIGGKQYLPRQP
jgi:VWFA-related protein